MNFMELIFVLEGRGETILIDKPLLIQTDKFLYIKSADGNWEQKPLPSIKKEIV